MAFEVYLIKNSATNKSYVGVTTKGYINRFNQHIWQSRKGGKTSALYSAMRKYGYGAFSIEKICDCADFDEMNSAEVYYISKLNTLSPNGYNLTSGGDAGTFSDELKEKCSKARSGERPHENTIKAITQKWSDSEWRNEQRRRISDGMAKSKKAKAAKDAQRGVKKSAAHVAALRNARATKVKCITTDCTFDAIADAVLWLRSNGWPKANHSKILRACKSEAYTAYGYKWSKVSC